MSVDLTAGVSYRDRASWLAGRRVGASSVASILGVSPYRGPWDVWLELRGEAPERPASVDQLRGHRWERRVLEDYELETGHRVSVPARPSIWTGPNPWETATPDGFSLDERNGLGVVEAKTDRIGRGWGDPAELDRWEDGAELVIRPDYAIQCYWLARCTRSPWVDLVVLLPRFELRTYRLWSDPATEEALGAAVASWYQRHVIEGEEPDPDASRACRDHARARLHARGRRPLLTATSEIAGLVEELAAARRAKKVSAELAEALSSTLALSLLESGASGFQLEDGRSARWTAGRSGHFRLYGFD